MDLDFDKIYSIPKIALIATGAHPYIPRNKKWALGFIINQGLFTALFINIIYNIVYHDLKSNNFSQMCKNGILFVVYIVITMQYIVLLLHQNSLLDVIKDMKRDYEKVKDMTPVERDVMYKYVNLSKWVCKQWLGVGISGNTMFFTKSIVLMAYSYYINDFKLVSFYELIYPQIIEKNKHRIDMFLLTYALVLHFGYYSASIYVGYVPLGPIFMLHACAQLELVQNRINDLFVQCDDEVIRKKLETVIVQLQYIYSFVDRIQGIFKIAYELTLKGSALMLPITCYELLEAFHRGEFSLEFLAFIVGGVLISSSPCYYSDLLMEKGEDVRLALYTCGWEQYYDRRTRTTLQLMLQNALRPIAIQTIFKTMCLDTLTDMFQQSYTIFNLINAMWD